MSALSPPRRLVGLALAAAACVVSRGRFRRERAAERRTGRAGRAVALRPRAQGLPRHRAQHDLEGVVHGRRRRAERRLLPDDRQHERRDAPVRRHRRLHVHRPSDEGHDLDRPGAGQQRHGLPGHEHAPAAASTRSSPTTSPIPSANTILMRVDFESTASGRSTANLRLYVRFDPTVNGNGGGGARQRRRRLGRRWTPRRVIRSSSPPTRTRRRTRSTATTPSRSTPPSTAPFAEVDQRLRRDGQRRARRSSTPSHALTTSYTRRCNGNVVQTARGRRQEARRRRPGVHARARLRREPGGRGADGGARAEARLRQGAPRLRDRAGTHYDKQARRPAEEAAGDQSKRGRRAAATRTS